MGVYNITNEEERGRREYKLCVGHWEIHRLIFPVLLPPLQNICGKYSNLIGYMAVDLRFKQKELIGVC